MRKAFFGTIASLAIWSCALGQGRAPQVAPAPAVPPVVKVETPAETVKWTDTGAFLLSLVGVLVAGAGVGAALGSLSALRKQVDANVEAAKAAREAAEAATRQVLLSEQQMKGAEQQQKASLRAYVRVFPSNPTYSEDGALFTAVVFTNVGRTPAKLLELKYHFVRSSTSLEEPSSSERYYERMLRMEEHGATLFPGENQVRNLSAHGSGEHGELFSQYPRWLYGELFYVDVFGDPQRTRFCVREENGAFVMDGSAAYHTST